MDEKFENLPDMYNPIVREMILKTKELLQKNIPGIQEIIDEKARIIAYGFGPKYSDYVCTIILSKNGVKLGFYRGGELPEKNKLLEGKGKVHKYVQINSDVLGSKAMKDLIKSAYSAYKKRKSQQP